MKERDFQRVVIEEIINRFPGCIVMKTDPTYIRSFPDLVILGTGGKWAALETKRSPRSPKQPNQHYYVARLDQMSYAGFIYPENFDQVLGILDDMFLDEATP